MALGDIKDAGVLIEVTRFGWPWHGVIAGGVVGSTGHPHVQPPQNMAYLIDTGLPALDLTPEQIASEAAFGREWRNYALLPRGTVYNKSIGADSFIHVDEAGKPWRISLTFSFPAAQTLRITAAITEFGVLEIHQGPATAITIQKTVDVVCTEIELLNAVSQQIVTGASYDSRTGTIQDVWTNGSKALVGVMLHIGLVSDLFSLVTLIISGVGGADGGGLNLAAVETIAQPALTTGSESFDGVNIYTPNFKASISEVCDCATVCPPDWTGTYTCTYDIVLSPDLYQTGGGGGSGATFARFAYFDSATGSAMAIRLRYATQTSYLISMKTGWSIDFTEGTGNCSAVVYSSETSCSPYDGPRPLARMTAERVDNYESGFWLLENDTVIDRLTWSKIETSNIDYSYQIGRAPPFLGTIDGATYALAESRGGALASYLPVSEEAIVGGLDLVAAFRSASASDYSNAANVVSVGTTIGIHRMNAHAAALFAYNSTSSAYGLVATPLGALAAGITPAATTNFAIQRKTGEYIFAVNPICYV
jgi:hypothetical protein